MIPKKHSHEEANESWLMSYADMITLLLAFFVIFVSTSEPKQDRLAAATKGMKEQFGTVSLDSPYDSVYKNIQGIVVSNNADRNIAVEKTPRGLQVEISVLNVFAHGTAEIPKKQLDMLKEVARSLKDTTLASFSIEVEGHTGSLPTTGEGFASNWELAAARATRIVRILVEEGIDPARLRATSYAETRPVVPNEDEQGNAIDANQEKNQRVVIRVEKIIK